MTPSRLLPVLLAVLLAGAPPAAAADSSCASGEPRTGVKTVTLLARKPGTSLEEFRRHYETVHVPGARARIPALARADYRRNFIGEARPGAPIDFDVVTEMRFASEAEYAEMRRTTADPAVSAWIAQDIAQFADPSKTRSYVVEECVSQ